MHPCRLAACVLSLLIAMAGPLGAQAVNAGPGLSRAPASSEAPAPTFAGCWQNRAPLYSDYSVAFCMQPNGTGAYRVQGGGYDCQGRSTWSSTSSGRRLVYQMGRGSCGATANWTADRIECTPGRVGRAEELACTYVPNANGFSPARFAASRHPDARR